MRYARIESSQLSASYLICVVILRFSLIIKMFPALLRHQAFETVQRSAQYSQPSVETTICAGAEFRPLYEAFVVYGVLFF